MSTYYVIMYLATEKDKRFFSNKELGDSTMAQTKTTRKAATTDVLTYAIEHGYDNAETIAIVQKVINNFTAHRKDKPAKTKARIANESAAKAIYEFVTARNLDTIDSKFIIEEYCNPSIASSQKVSAVMKVAVDMGYFTKEIDEKKRVTYKIVTE